MSTPRLSGFFLRVLGALLLLLIAIELALRFLWAGPATDHRVVWSMSSAENLAIQDLSGPLLLVSKYLMPGLIAPPKTRILLVDAQSGGTVRQIFPAGWVRFAQDHKDTAPECSLRLVDQRRRILGVQGPWLVLMDALDGSEVRRVLPDKDLLEPSPGTYRARSFAFAVSPADGSTAIAYNIGASPRLYVYTHDLAGLLYASQLERYIEDVAWSPDGRQLALLYSGSFDEHRNFVGFGPSFKELTLPDVEVLDGHSGAKLAAFFSGGRERQIAFSRDGNLLYTITAPSLSDTAPGKLCDGVMRVISWKSGQLIRVLEHPATGLRTSFALSGDGKWVAADASTALPHLFFTEPDPFGDRSRFVVLDALTGKVQFEIYRRTSTAREPNLVFSGDSRLLFAVLGPGRSGQERARQESSLTAYCVAPPCK